MYATSEGTVAFLSFVFQNLDVNLAVNNLLSRDEDDGDDDENPEYLPGGKKKHP